MPLGAVSLIIQFDSCVVAKCVKMDGWERTRAGSPCCKISGSSSDRMTFCSSWCGRSRMGTKRTQHRHRRYLLPVWLSSLQGLFRHTLELFLYTLGLGRSKIYLNKYLEPRGILELVYREPRGILEFLKISWSWYIGSC